MPKAKQSLNELLYDLKRIEENREKMTEKKIRKIYKQLSKDLNTFISEEYLKYANADGALAYTTLQDKTRQARFLQEIVEQVDGITPEVEAELTALVEKTYENCYKGMQKAVKNASNTQKLSKVITNSAATPEVIKQSFENNISKLTLPNVLQKNRQEIIYQIKQELTIGLINGDRYDQIAKKIAKKVDVSYTKATNIARTESHRNIESGLLDSAENIAEGLEDSDLIPTATWRTMQDERVRPFVRRKTKSGWKTYINKNGANHQVMDGVTIKVGEKFDLGDGVYTKAPSLSGVAAHDCNCRCFLEYDYMTEKEFAEATNQSVEQVREKYGDKSLDNSDESGIIKENKYLSVGDCNNNAELSQYLQQQYNIQCNVSVGNLEYSVVQNALTGCEAMIQEFPELGMSLQNITTTNKGVMACSGETIKFNPQYFSDTKTLSKICKINNKTGWAPQNTTPASIGVHECGHAIEQLLINANSAYTNNTERILAWNNCTEAESIVSRAVKNIKKTTYGKGQKTDNLIKGISEYAFKGDFSETMAEAFADVYANGSNANPLSIEIKKIAKERLKQYQKKGSVTP